MSNHIYRECDCGDDRRCPVCQGLAICTECGGAEASLSTECCGRELNGSEEDSIQNGTLDFIDGNWVVI